MPKLVCTEDLARPDRAVLRHQAVLWTSAEWTAPACLHQSAAAVELTHLAGPKIRGVEVAIWVEAHTGLLITASGVIKGYDQVAICIEDPDQTISNAGGDIPASKAAPSVSRLKIACPQSHDADQETRAPSFESEAGHGIPLLNPGINPPWTSRGMPSTRTRPSALRPVYQAEFPRSFPSTSTNVNAQAPRRLT